MALTALAAGEEVQMSPPVRRWLRGRLLIDDDKRLAIPVFGRWLLERGND